MSYRRFLMALGVVLSLWGGVTFATIKGDTLCDYSGTDCINWGDAIFDLGANVLETDSLKDTSGNDFFESCSAG